jgi:hypothetical protein
MLDDKQKDLVRQWAAEGAGLSEIQRRIKDEFGISMTYMDVRFLMLDLHADVKDKPEPKAATPPPPPAPVGADALPSSSADAAASADEDEDDGYTPPGMEGGNVKVELDRVVRAGAMASGSVTFSDGVTGGWYLDQMGRLALTKISKPGYQPSREDLEAFQIELQNKLTGGY